MKIRLRLTHLKIEHALINSSSVWTLLGDLLANELSSVDSLPLKVLSQSLTGLVALSSRRPHHENSSHSCKQKLVDFVVLTLV